METKPSLLDALREAVRGPGWAPGRRTAGGRMPSLDRATGWVNSPPLTTEGLRGRVVAVDFWTYTCINWLRTVPYLRAWDEAYRDAGLVVLGVHTPEFPFEQDVDNVQRAIQDRRITYPVALDSGYGIWSAFTNMYWPALYVVDAQGYLRFHHFGEGAYQESEQVIRQLLAEAGVGDRLPEPVTVEAWGIEAAADWAHLGSAENYLGAERTENFASPEGAAVGTPRRYTLPSDWPRITGPSPGGGRSSRMPCCCTNPADGSPAGSPPGTCTWSSPRRRAGSRCGSASTSTVSRRVPTTGTTSTTTAPAPSRSRGCTNSSASAARSRIARSRSPSTAPAFGPSPSRSVNRSMRRITVITS